MAEFCDICGKYLPAGCRGIADDPECPVPPRTDPAFLIGSRANGEMCDWHLWDWFNEEIDEDDQTDLVVRMGQAAIAAPIRHPLLIGQAMVDAARSAPWFRGSIAEKFPDYSSQCWNDFLVSAGRAALGTYGGCDYTDDGCD
jgi:hypothetical protein